jgi:hypothetical protein
MKEKPNYNLTPFQEFFDFFMTPKELAYELRQIQLRYTQALLDLALNDPEGDHPSIIKDTIDDMYHLAELAEAADKIQEN